MRYDQSLMLPQFSIESWKLSSLLPSPPRPGPGGVSKSITQQHRNQSLQEIAHIRSYRVACPI